MKLKSINIISGWILILISLLVFIPSLILIIVSKGGGFGVGLMLIPIYVPLSFTVSFGIAGVINKKLKFKRLKWVYIFSHVITGIGGLITFMLMPVLPIAIIVIPIILWMVAELSEKNIDIQLLIIILSSIVIGISLLLMELEYGNFPVIELIKYGQ